MLRQHCAIWRLLPPWKRAARVHFPGAHMAEVRSDNMENGIPVEEAIWQQVLAL